MDPLIDSPLLGDGGEVPQQEQVPVSGHLLAGFHHNWFLIDQLLNIFSTDSRDSKHTSNASSSVIL